MVRRAAAVAGAGAAGVLGWSLFESQWVEFRVEEVELSGLPPELDGLTIVHLSDFHLGTISFNGRALERAVRWASETPCDIVAITGDLLSRRRGEPQLEEAVAALQPRLGVFAVLGNHDVEVTRDPFSQPTDASVVENAGAVLLENDSVLHEVNGTSVQIVGGDQSLGSHWSNLANRPTHRPISASCSSISRTSSATCRRVHFTSFSPAICTAARSASRRRDARCGSSI